MPSENILPLVWPSIHHTASIVALVLALAILLFGAFSGGWANRARIILAVCLSTAIGWLAMPLALQAARALHILDAKAGGMIVVTAMMLFVSAVAAGIYEIVTVTLPDIGLSPRK